MFCFFFQAEDGIRDLVRSRGLGDVYKRQCHRFVAVMDDGHGEEEFKTMVYIWVRNNWAYNLTFTAKPDKYEELKPTAQKVVESFKFAK